MILNGLDVMLYALLIGLLPSAGWMEEASNQITDIKSNPN
jgi:hypothetical protein